MAFEAKLPPDRRKLQRAEMMIRTMIARLPGMARSLSVAVVIASMPHPDFSAAAAASVSPSTASQARFLSLGIGKSVVIDLPRDIRDVLVADPKIANAVVRSAQRAYVIGAAVGQTNIVFFDSAGQQIAAYDIAVTRDLNGVRAMLRQAFPSSNIRIEGVGDGTILTGSTANPAEAQQAGDLAARLVGDSGKVVNNIVVRGRDQVMLKVTVAEMQRNIVKQLGIDLSGSAGGVSVSNSNPFTANGGALVSSNSVAVNLSSSMTATLRAMESANVIRTLAEPNLTAISGESATFIAGGEFPVPAGYSCDPSTHVCTTQISYKKFGVSLNFTPLVMSEGRISLHVMTEVSELSSDHAITITQQASSTSNNSITIPSIRTRRADTTLELPSGGSMALAGLLQDQTKQAINGLPGLTELPILGALFRSRDYVNGQTELVILITPYIVRAVAQKDLSRPDDGFADAADPEAIFLGNINRIYGTPGSKAPSRNYYGKYGFITD
jgi:pilus assembly protein CpaC